MKTHDCTDILNLFGTYSQLNEGQRNVVDRHTAECENCARALEIVLALEEAFATTSDTDVPDRFTDRVMTAAQQTRTPADNRALVVLACVTAVQLLLLMSRFEAVTALAARIANSATALWHHGVLDTVSGIGTAIGDLRSDVVSVAHYGQLPHVTVYAAALSVALMLGFASCCRKGHDHA